MLKPNANPRYSWDDIGNGNLFADFFKDSARYVPERKEWFVYDGSVWQHDCGKMRVMEMCKELSEKLGTYAFSLLDDKASRDYIQFVSHWKRRANREKILKDAESVFPIASAEFDRDPMLFNCQNGTLNLTTGAFTPHRAEDKLTKLSGVIYDPDARCERWERFIGEVMCGDREKALFLQKALGYSLTGDTRHECFFILFGATSRNGKGTCMETVMKMMGDYGKTANPESFTQKQSFGGNGHTEDIARLQGARFVNISEPDKGMKLSAARVKTLTGNDTISSRFMYSGTFEFKPDFKLFINTNYLPQVSDATLFTSGRVKVIPFERHFSEGIRDTGLKSELAKPENLSGILNWCVEGLRILNRDGFAMPDSVRAAIEDYRADSDKVGRFLSEACEQAPNGEERTSEVYASYKHWCEQNGHYHENMPNFIASLRLAAVVTKKRPAGKNQGATNMLTGYYLREDYKQPMPF